MTVISVHEVKIDYSAVTAALGFGCTTRAVEERLKKIKKRARTASGSITNDSKAALGMATTGIATKSPPTKKRKAPVSVLASQKKAKKDEGPKEAVEEDDIDDYDDDEEEGGVKLKMEGETYFEHSGLGTQGCGLLLEEGLVSTLTAEMDEHDKEMYELLPYEEDELEPRVV